MTLGRRRRRPRSARGPLALRRRIGFDHLEVERRGHERPRVGVRRALEDRAGRRRARRSRPARITITSSAQRPDHPQVVADEEIGEPVPRLQVAQEVDDLRLDGDDRGPRSARRGRSAGASARARGRWRCAAAGRPRTRAGSGRGVAGSSPTSVSASSIRALALRGAPADARGRRALRRRSARPTSAARASRRDPGRRSASPGGAAGAPPAPSALDVAGPGTGCGPRSGARRRSARPSVVLPEPLSPTTPTVWPSRIVDAHAVHRLDVVRRVRRSSPP